MQCNYASPSVIGGTGATFYDNGLYGQPGAQQGSGTGPASASASEPQALRTSIHRNQLYTPQGEGAAWLDGAEGGGQYEGTEAEADAVSPRTARMRSTSAASSVARSSSDGDSGNYLISADCRRCPLPAQPQNP